MNYYSMVKEFMTAMGQPVETGKVSDMRAALIKEERMEFLKEAADLVYVLVGGAVEDCEMHALNVEHVSPIVELVEWIGMDFNGAFAEVHRSNMSKLGLDGKPCKRADGKILKGPNYSPANMEAFV